MWFVACWRFVCVDMYCCCVRCLLCVSIGFWVVSVMPLKFEVPIVCSVFVVGKCMLRVVLLVYLHCWLCIVCVSLFGIGD